VKSNFKLIKKNRSDELISSLAYSLIQPPAF